MGEGSGVWFGLLAGGLLLLVLGVEGRLGVALACVLTPRSVRFKTVQST